VKYTYTGKELDAGTGLMYYGARYYDPALGRFIGADTRVPGTAASSGGGAATLGYDDQVRLTPLTVGFHETQFLSVVGEENREIAAKGFWFQRSDEEKRQSRYQWGPPNPQALNRYAYCLGNPPRYVDPTGHLAQIWVPQEQVLALVSELRKLGMDLAAGTIDLADTLLGDILIGPLKLLDIKALGDYLLDLAGALEELEGDPNGVWILYDDSVNALIFGGKTIVYGGSASKEEVKNLIHVQIVDQPASWWWIYYIYCQNYPYQLEGPGPWKGPDLENAHTGPWPGE